MRRVPITTLLLALTGAVPIDIARRALAEPVRLAEHEVFYRSNAPLREREAVQLVVGDADSMAGFRTVTSAMVCHKLFHAPSCD